MKEGYQTLESSYKVQEFKNEIRSRMKTDHMKKVRQQFICLESSTNPESTFHDPNDLISLLNQHPDKTKVCRINKIVFDLRENLPSDLLTKVAVFIKNWVLQTNPADFILKLEANDLIALLGNILSLDHFKCEVTLFFDLSLVLDFMVTVVQLAHPATANLGLWILFQLIQIAPQSALHRVASLQVSLKQKFGIGNNHFAYIICEISERQPSLVQINLVSQYLDMQISKQTNKYFCQQIVIILSIHIKNTPNTPLADKIIQWISYQISSFAYPSDQKQNILKLLHLLLRSKISVLSLARMVENSSLIYEIVQRSLYDNEQEKTSSITLLNEIFKNIPQASISDFVRSYPNITQVLVTSLSLLQHQIVIDSLISIGRIVMVQKGGRIGEIRSMFLKAGLEIELQILKNSKNSQVSNFASLLIENYLNYE